MYVLRSTGPAADNSYAQCFGLDVRPREVSSHETLEQAFLALCEAGYKGDDVNADIRDCITGRQYTYSEAREALVQG